MRTHYSLIYSTHNGDDAPQNPTNTCFPSEQFDPHDKLTLFWDVTPIQFGTYVATFRERHGSIVDTENGGADSPVPLLPSIQQIPQPRQLKTH